MEEKYGISEIVVFAQYRYEIISFCYTFGKLVYNAVLSNGIGSDIIVPIKYLEKCQRI